MASTILILGLATVCVALAWTLLHGRHAEIRNLADWEANRHEVDIEMLKNLLDSGEEHYLRTHLSRTQFCSFQRKRIRLTLELLKLIEANAAMLMRLGQLARMSTDPVLTRRGTKLSTSALQLRSNILLLRACLSVRWIFPSWSMALPTVESGYQELMDRFLFVQQSYRQALP